MSCAELCKALQKHHLTYKHIDYIQILSNKGYQKAMGYSNLQIQTYIRNVWDRHLELSAFDEIRNGKRQKKNIQYFQNVSL
tara:strand:- start:2497 stop:2739 length:243 start_codon:yes stop_codon:yes gene_type:complete